MDWKEISKIVFRHFLNWLPVWASLTHWGRVTHICVSKLTIIASDNGLSPDRHQAIIWTNAGLLLIGPFGTNFSEILTEIIIFSFKKLRLKVLSAKRRPFCLGLNVLTPIDEINSGTIIYVVLLSVLHSQYHACWCTGDFESQCISRHDIDLQNPEYSVSNRGRLNSSPLDKMKTKLKTLWVPFRQWTSLSFGDFLNEVCCLGCDWWIVIIGLNNGLVPNRRQLSKPMMTQSSYTHTRHNRESPGTSLKTQWPLGDFNKTLEK